MFALIGQSGVAEVQHSPLMFQHGDASRHVIGAPEHRLNLRHHDIGINRLRDEIVAAHVHCHDDVHVVRSRGNEDDGNVGDGTDGTAPVVSVEKGEHDVHEHHVRRTGGKLPQNVLKLFRHVHLMSPRLKLALHHFRHGGVVLYDHDLIHGSNASCFFLIVA